MLSRLKAGRSVVNALLKERKAPLRELGKLPPVVTGCAGMHRLGNRWSLPRERHAFAVLDAALESGSNAFDTAAVYGGGASEEVLGRWIRSRRIREQVIVITKGGHPVGSEASRVHPKFLREDLHDSLRRLRTDYIDLYLLHRDDLAFPVERIVDVLHGFVQEGKVRAIGASNWSHTRIEQANLYAEAHGLTPFTVSSPHFSLVEMYEPPWPGCVSITGEAGAPARAWYAATRMPILAWSPLGGGFVAGRDPTDEAFVRAYQSEANRKRRERADVLAKKHGVSVVQIALAYVRGQELEAHPVVAASTPERMRSLMETRVRLTADELRWLDLTTSRLDTSQTPEE